MKKLMFATAFASFFCSTTVFAADGVWSNTAGGTWSVSSNWEAGMIADGVGSSATFNGSVSAPVVVNAGFTLGMLIVSPFTYG
ncbi:MAG: hypothetical protein PHO37_00785 [Kiritimatiellae bacterium]|nr:hypothetical protein [Kiritimatiellia bacterium]